MSNIDEVMMHFTKESATCLDSKMLEELRLKYLGKKGLINDAMSQMGNIPPEERRDFGAKINLVKEIITNKLDELKISISSSEMLTNMKSEKIDVTIPSYNLELGMQHPITKVITDIENYFSGLGFVVADNLEIDDELNNFDYLNIAHNHPARQMHDTFFLEDGRVLRTHTSNMQVRFMKERKPPVRFINVGKVYRSDDDATHSPMFHQLEVVCVDEGIHMGHLKYLIESFLKFFFEIDDAPIRLRASHFPFTEPSAEVDVQCDRSRKDDLVIGKGSDWLEILGCGMIHPKVLENAGLDSSKYQGFALGCGIERLAMLKYNIPDLRKFYEGNVNWLKYYGF